MEAAAEITSLFDSNGYLIEQATTNVAVRDKGMDTCVGSMFKQEFGPPLVTREPFKDF